MSTQKGLLFDKNVLYINKYDRNVYPEKVLQILLNGECENILDTFKFNQYMIQKLYQDGECDDVSPEIVLKDLLYDMQAKDHAIRIQKAKTDKERLINFYWYKDIWKSYKYKVILSPEDILSFNINVSYL